MANQPPVRTFTNRRSRSVVLYTVIALVLVIAAISGIVLAKNRSSQLSASHSRPVEVAKAPSTDTNTQKTDTKSTNNDNRGTTTTPKPAPAATPSPTTTPAPTTAPNTGPSETVPSTGPNDLNITLSVIGIMAVSLSGTMFIRSRRQLVSSIIQPSLQQTANRL